MSIELLNHDCLFYIFAYLDLPTVINLEDCGAHLAAAAVAYYSQIHEVKFMLRTLNPNHVESILLRVGPSLRSFTFSGGYIMNNELRDRIVQALTHCSNHLRALTINYVTFTETHVLALKPLMPNLVELDLSHVHLTDALLEGVLSINLKSLNLCGNTQLNGSCLATLKHLNHLDVSYCFELVAEDFYRFLRNGCTLKYLNVSGCGGLSKKNFWQELVQHQAKIEELVMKDLNAVMPPEINLINLKDFNGSGKHFFESFRFE